MPKQNQWPPGHEFSTTNTKKKETFAAKAKK